jgi:DNA-binding response OmpR family regulator
MNIWLLEDDPAQAELLTTWLTGADHAVRHFSQGNDIIAALAGNSHEFDLIILDWELPDTTGVEVLNEIRHTVSWHVPVLFVTQREAEADIVNALASGADDYMVKQISSAEFLARVQALGRRLASQELDFEVGPYLFKPQSQTIMLNGESCDLTAKDFDLAWYLFRHIGRLLSREQLLRDVWGVSGLNTRTVDVHVSRIRKRMNINPEQGFRIKTIYQHGYRLEQLS